MNTASEKGFSVQIEQTGTAPLHVSFSCLPGQILVLLGPFGSGKTRLLNLMAGLERPSRRSLAVVQMNEESWIDTRIRLNTRPCARQVGMVFQGNLLMPHLTAQENIMLALLELPVAQRQVRARYSLEQVHFEVDAFNKKPHELSPVQCFKVAVARALVQSPKVLLLDEPFGLIDRMSRIDLYNLLADLRSRLNIPIVLATSNMREARLLGDELLLIDEGTMLQTGPVLEVCRYPKDMKVARFLGIQNQFEGRWLGPSTREGWGRLQWLGADLARSMEFPVVSSGSWAVNARVHWVLHQDGLRVYQGGEIPADHMLLPVVLSNCRILGGIALLDCRVLDALDLLLRLSVDRALDQELKTGQTIKLLLNLRCLHVVSAI